MDLVELALFLETYNIEPSCVEYKTSEIVSMQLNDEQRRIMVRDWEFQIRQTQRSLDEAKAQAWKLVNVNERKLAVDAITSAITSVLVPGIAGKSITILLGILAQHVSENGPTVWSIYDHIKHSEACADKADRIQMILWTNGVILDNQ